jgi:catechol 2,3-dioxygenase-like lactoylglutathione lyase family enzyme
MQPHLTGLCPLLQVFDMLESVRFYREHLGFEIAQQSPRVEHPYPHFNWALLKRDGAELMLNTAYEADERPATREAERCASHRDVGLFFGCPDVDRAYEALKSAGVASKPPKVTHYGMKQLYFRDPDGFEICLQWPA